MGQVGSLLLKEKFFRVCGDSSKNIEKLYSLYVAAVKSKSVKITNEFYDRSICGFLESVSSNILVNVFGYGFSNDADRVLISFGYHDRNDISIFENSARVLKISYSDKFNKLSHKDFLGSIMSLGFAREKMGDLVLEGNCAYVPVVEDFVGYVIQNLKKVRNVYVDVGFELFNKLPRKNFEILYRVVGSLRIDGIVSALTNLSRENSKKIIKNSKVKINGFVELDIDTKVCEDDIVTINGYGKFKIRENLGSTAKNKIKIIVDKFI